MTHGLAGLFTSPIFVLLITPFLLRYRIDTIVLCYINLNPVGVLLGVDGYLSQGLVWPIEDAFGYILLQAFGSVIRIGLINRAYQLRDASYVALHEYSIFIFAPLL